MEGVHIVPDAIMMAYHDTNENENKRDITGMLYA